MYILISVSDSKLQNWSVQVKTGHEAAHAACMAAAITLQAAAR